MGSGALTFNPEAQSTYGAGHLRANLIVAFSSHDDDPVSGLGDGTIR
jgi:hypothetical protein